MQLLTCTYFKDIFFLKILNKGLFIVERAKLENPRVGQRGFAFCVTPTVKLLN